jgi:hypothetical protein
MWILPERAGYPVSDHRCLGELHMDFSEVKLHMQRNDCLGDEHRIEDRSWLKLISKYHSTGKQ